MKIHIRRCYWVCFNISSFFFIRIVSLRQYSIVWISVCQRKAGPLDTFLNKLCSNKTFVFNIYLSFHLAIWWESNINLMIHFLKKLENMLLIYSSKHDNTVMLYEFITFTEKLIQFSEESCKIEVMTERELAAEEIAKATDIIADFIYPRFVRLDSAKDLKNVKSKIFSIQLNFIISVLYLLCLFFRSWIHWTIFSSVF